MDRKAWIVVTICSILLVLNLWMNSKNAEEARKAREQAEEQLQNSTEQATEQPALTKDPLPPIETDGEKKSLTIETPKAKFNLSTLEGGIEWTEFKEEVSVHDPEINVRMNDQGNFRIGALTTLAGEALDLPYYRLSPETSAEQTQFIGKLKNGLGVFKTWSRVTAEEEGADYRLKLRLKLVNRTAASIPLGQIALATGSAAPLYEEEQARYLNFFWKEDGDYDSEAATYFQGSFFSKPRSEYREEKPEGVEFSGVENQFFATIVDPADTYRATVRALSDTVDLPPSRGKFGGSLIQTFLTLPDESLDPNQAKELTFDIFVGPKKNSLLRSLDGEKGEVMNYGFFTGGISRLLNWTLNKLAALFGTPGNSWAWGWAIVALTIIVRFVMWPLHAKSTRTMKRMSKLQPKMAALKEKYPDDPNKMNQEMMKLYREFGVNPMGGCLPLLLQIPIFFGYFTMLQYAVELRNQPFLGWVKDLSQPDTVAHLPFSIPFLGSGINILPILMAITMVLQMKMTPQTGDKLQRRLFMLMPIIFFLFCYNFASALALYWTTQNIFSIAQTWFMQRMPEPELNKSKKAGKKTWMQKLAERAEEAQRMQKQGKRPGTPQKPSKPKKPRGPRTGG